MTSPEPAATPPRAITAAAGAIWDLCRPGSGVPGDLGQWCNAIARAALEAAAPHLIAEREDGAGLIAAERRRQVEAEGWTPEHDAAHHEGELARAAACYALAASAPFFANRIERGLWPSLWDFKRADPVRMLAKAGALIAAEIDRLLREQP